MLDIGENGRGRAMNSRHEPLERHSVAEQIARVIGLLSTGFVVFGRLSAASVLNDAVIPMLFGWPFVTGLLIGALSAVQFRRGVPWTGIIVTVVVILGTWLLRNVWPIQSVNTSGETVTFLMCGYEIAVMLPSSIIGAVVGGYVWRAVAARNPILQ